MMTSTAGIPAEDAALAWRVEGKHSGAHQDGWQWRKYGEKVVKGSRNPRSYYKCSHAGCPGKKIVEKKASGEVVSTEYREEHSHPAPIKAKISRARVKVEKDHGAGMFPHLIIGNGFMHPSGMMHSPAALRTDIQTLDTDMYGDDNDDEPHAYGMAAGGAVTEPVLRSATSAEARAAVEASEVIRRLREEAQNNTSPSKRLDALAAYAEEAERQFDCDSRERGLRRKAPWAENAPEEGSGGSPTEDGSGSPGSVTDLFTTAQRVVDSDSLEDGYKWRKYGQKHVKGNPHPRSYYKCTHPGCTVRKHVEIWAGDDTKTIISYEGQHGHPAPGSTSVSARLKTKGKGRSLNGDAKEEGYHASGSDDVNDAADGCVSRPAKSARVGDTTKMAAHHGGLKSESALVSHLPPPDVSLMNSIGGSLEAFTYLMRQQALLDAQYFFEGSMGGQGWDLTMGSLLSPRGRKALGGEASPMAGGLLSPGEGSKASAQQHNSSPPPLLLQAIKEARKAHLATVAGGMEGPAASSVLNSALVPVSTDAAAMHVAAAASVVANQLKGGGGF